MNPVLNYENYFYKNISCNIKFKYGQVDFILRPFDWMAELETQNIVQSLELEDAGDGTKIILLTDHNIQLLLKIVYLNTNLIQQMNVIYTEEPDELEDSVEYDSDSDIETIDSTNNAVESYFWQLKCDSLTMDRSANLSQNRIILFELFDLIYINIIELHYKEFMSPETQSYFRQKEKGKPKIDLTGCPNPVIEEDEEVTAFDETIPMLIEIAKGLPENVWNKITLRGLFVLARYQDRQRTVQSIETMNIIEHCLLQYLYDANPSKDGKRNSILQQFRKHYSNSLKKKDIPKIEDDHGSQNKN